MINWEKETFKIMLNDFSYNAGVMGFLDILIESGDLNINDLPQNNVIELPFSVLDNFEEKYIRVMVDRYKHLGFFHNLVREYEKLKVISEDNSYETKKLVLEMVADLTSKNSRVSVFKTMENIPFEVTGNEKEKESKIKAIMNLIKKELKMLVDTKTRKLSDEEKRNIVDGLFDTYKPLIDKIIEHEDDFYMKEIMYLVITNFWNNRSFLSGAKVNNKIMQMYDEVFILPTKWQFENPVKKVGGADVQCLECGIDIEKKSTKINEIKIDIVDNFMWIVDKGIDSKRKTSIFWDGRPDDFLCPLCRLIYSCMPLGFKVYKSVPMVSMFINSNYSIYSMYNLNITMQGEDLSANRFEYQNFAKIVQSYFKAHIDYIKDVPKIGGLQLIRKRHGDRFKIDLISPLHMKVIKDRLKDFETLTNKYIKDEKNRKNDADIYQEVVNNFVNNNNLNQLVDKYIKMYLSDMNFNPYYLFNIVEIQHYANHLMRGGNKLDYKSNDLLSWKINGAKMRKALEDNDKDFNNRMKKYYYQLSSAVNVGDKKAFIHTMMTQHVSLNMELPYKMLSLQENMENFESYGQAYLIGLLTKYDN